VANKKKQSGISLTEILVVVGIIAVLMGVSIPAAKQLAGSFETGTGVRQLINAALSNARAIAVREQTYAGVRFQQDAEGHTYMIFIVHDKAATGLANGFRAVMGRKPMQLPENVSVTATVVDLTNNITGSHDFFSFEEDAVDWSSVQSFTIKTKDGNETTEYISPYTGELVMEYRQQNP
jgi:Tfp pilus assembly protein FimT